MAPQPEQQARAEIDRLLHAAGWQVFELKNANIHDSHFSAIQKLPLPLVAAPAGLTMPASTMTELQEC